jgi:hypothetical protein
MRREKAQVEDAHRPNIVEANGPVCQAAIAKNFSSSHEVDVLNVFEALYEK